MTTLDQFISRNGPLLRKGPVAIVFAEDEVEVASTLRHTRRAGFSLILLLGQRNCISCALPDQGVVAIEHDVHSKDAVPLAVNKVIAAAKSSWIYYCFNGEYLFHPFCESRDVVEMFSFHAAERREAILTYVIDLYSPDLASHPNAVDVENAMFDGSGYFALQRFRDLESTPLERQMDIFGGPRWRFEEHVPMRSRRIDRISLFKAKPGLQLRPDFTLNDEEMNTISCPWHNNLTAAIASFRAAKALRQNPGSAAKISDFTWEGSRKLGWNSQQLLDLGFIEPGQWF